jgi:hypothetical protein
LLVIDAGGGDWRKERAMAKDNEIDAQVDADREFTRRAQQLMNRLRTQTTASRSTEEPVKDEKDETERE